MAKLTIIEGTPEEILSISKGIVTNEHKSTDIIDTASAPETKPEGEKFVSKEIAKAILKRRPLSSKQKLILEAIAKGYPNWVSASIIQKASTCTPAEFAGVMGAFGRRISHTKGHIPKSEMIESKWNYDAKAYDYRIPEHIFETLKETNII